MRTLFLCIAIAFSVAVCGQSFVVTPDGLKDSQDQEKTFVVINVEGLTAKQLFDNAMKYINKNYKNPENVIKGETESEYLKFITHVPNFLVVKNTGAKILIDANYTTELSFKDGKVKYEIIELDMYNPEHGYKVLFSGGAFDGYPIYNKKGDLKRPDTKKEIEIYFSAEISKLVETFKGKKDNW